LGEGLRGEGFVNCDITPLSNLKNAFENRVILYLKQVYLKQNLKPMG
jgi:hypothetical protein